MLDCRLTTAESACHHYKRSHGSPIDYPSGYRRRTIFRAERAVERYNKTLRQMWGRSDPRSREEQIEEVRAEVEDGCDYGYWHLIPMTRNKPGHCRLCKYVGHSYIYQCVFLSAHLSLDMHATQMSLPSIDGRKSSSSVNGWRDGLHC